MVSAKSHAENVHLLRAVHWASVIVALMPVPFEIGDFVRLRLWQVEWWSALSAAFAAVLSAAAYFVTRWLLTWSVRAFRAAKQERVVSELSGESTRSD